DKNMDEQGIKTVQMTLLSQGNLEAHVRTAEDMLKRQFQEQLKPIQAKSTRDSFWFAIISGIASNILYSLLLIVVFVVAKDQLGSWLSSLIESKP
ncbi:hypothetical protein CGK04_24200, partial [Vibrio parahaemolyticus]|uniref:hypothetical protein n=2 Tax=Vibrionaceae TaxID=641 RepID=UPI0011673D28